MPDLVRRQVLVLDGVVQVRGREDFLVVDPRVDQVLRHAGRMLGVRAAGAVELAPVSLQAALAGAFAQPGRPGGFGGHIRVLRPTTSTRPLATSSIASG